MKLEAINNHIIFQFIDRVNIKGEFEEGASKGGIVLKSNFRDSSASPRWGKIISAGPDCSDMITKSGCEVLIDNLKWTAGTKFNNTVYWRTDESHVLGYRYRE
jgi:hypothetical protein